jgi:hypothetical protein
MSECRSEEEEPPWCHDWCSALTPNVTPNSSGTVEEYFSFFSLVKLWDSRNGVSRNELWRPRRLMGMYEHWPLWSWKVGQIKNPGDIWCTCTLARSIYHKKFTKNGPVKGSIGFFLFSHSSPKWQTENHTGLIGNCSTTWPTHTPNIKSLRQISFELLGVYELWPLWPWKVGQIKNPEDMWCTIARSTLARSTLARSTLARSTLARSTLARSTLARSIKIGIH